MRGHADRIQSGPKAAPAGGNGPGSIGSGTTSRINSHLGAVDGYVSTMVARVRQGGDNLHSSADRFEENESRIKDSFDKIRGAQPPNTPTMPGPQPSQAQPAPAERPHSQYRLDGQTGRLGRLGAPGNTGSGVWAPAQSPQSQPSVP
jgi:hypothetical protein